MALICPILSHLYTSSDDTTNRRQLKRRALSPCYSEERCEESTEQLEALTALGCTAVTGNLVCPALDEGGILEQFEVLAQGRPA